MDLLRPLLSMALVFGLLGAAVWLLRRGPARWARPRTGARSLETIDRLPLSSQHSLHLVRAGSRTLLIAVHPGGCSLLTRLKETST